MFLYGKRLCGLCDVEHPTYWMQMQLELSISMFFVRPAYHYI